MKIQFSPKLLSKNPLSKKILKRKSYDKLSFSKTNKSFYKFYINRKLNDSLDIFNNSRIKLTKEVINSSFINSQNLKKSDYIRINKKENQNANKNIRKLSGETIPYHEYNKERILKLNINPAKTKTIFEKIIEDIGKIKIKTNKTLNIIKKNVKITNEESSKRTKKLIKYLKVNSHKNISTKKKNDILKNNNNTNNKEFKSNFSLNNILLDNINRINGINKNMKINDTNHNENTEKKGKLFKSAKKNMKLSHRSSHYLGIIKIPSFSLNSIMNQNMGYDIKDRMFHCRKFNISKEVLKQKFEKLNNSCYKIMSQNLYIKEKKLQLKDIFNKINLVLDNINFFKTNYMHKGKFYSAFDNMNNKKKAEFNLVLEEICFLLIKIVPQLLKNFYVHLERLLYVKFPDVEQEMEKVPQNEKECLNYNYSFFNIVTFYFNACIEILREIDKKNKYFKYTFSEYSVINNYLNLIRYDSCIINSIAKNQISKTITDNEILEKFEIGLGIRKIKKNTNEDIFERYYKRLKHKILDETIKLDRINSALNFKSKSFSSRKLIGKKGNKLYFGKRNIKSLLNNPVVINMMKYFKNSIKSQIISQQAIELYKIKEENNKIFIRK